MKKCDVIVIGAGPAGLSAAIEVAAKGMEVIVFDENARPGGQLFKQIHKFFGSKEHQAKERGFRIGEKLLNQAVSLGVQVVLDAKVVGFFDHKHVLVVHNNRSEHYIANKIVIATGASENMLPFPGWTLPGVIGAGAAQTMMNLHGIRPGNKALMIGSGNVGVVVAYQLLQAGCQVVAVVDAAPTIGGYGVHAAKIARMGVPFYLSHTIQQAHGKEQVEGATIVAVDSKWKTIVGSEKFFPIDTICIAVGLSPMSQLTQLAGCKMEENPAKGGIVPVCDEYGQTSVEGIFAAGDVSGIEEASSAMIKGRIAGASIAYSSGYSTEDEFVKAYSHYRNSLSQLRKGMFAIGEKGKEKPLYTDEGQKLSHNLLTHGFVIENELTGFPGIPDEQKKKQKITPVIECTQNIPCNPCQDACFKGCIQVGGKITNLPSLASNVNCTGCGKCVASCPGQAIFLISQSSDDGFASVTIPYELYPLPQKGDQGVAYDRAGKALGVAAVTGVQLVPANDQTALLTMRVPADWVMKARFFKTDSILAKGESHYE
jgi:thioredoxin reductase/Fe-S-cluster-containing hydrogenase component 2